MAKRKRKTKEQQVQAAVTKKRRRSARKYTLYYLIALLLVVGVGATLSLTVFFGVEQLVVVGSTRYAEGALLEQTGILLGDNLWRLPTGDIRKALIDRFPYIADVKIERRLPDSVTIRVTEAAPVQAIEVGSQSLLLDERGRVLEDSLPRRLESWPRVVGIDAGTAKAGDYLSPEQLERFAILQELTGLMSSAGLTDMGLIDLTDPLSLRMLWNNRVAVELGSRLDLEYKLRFAKHALESLEDDAFVGTLDVSVRQPFLKPENILTSALWPFAPALLSDYERQTDLRSAMPSSGDEPSAGVAGQDEEATLADASAAAPQPQPPSEPPPQSQLVPEPQPEPEPQSEPEPQPKPEPQSEPQSELRAVPESAPAPEPPAQSEPPAPVMGPALPGQ